MEIAASEEISGLVWMSDMYTSGDSSNIMLSTLEQQRQTLFPEASSQLDEFQPHPSMVTYFDYHPNTNMFTQDTSSEGLMMYDEISDRIGNINDLEDDISTVENIPKLIITGQRNGHSSDFDSENPPTPKKVKSSVTKHPALRLKTPIAYQRDTDPNIIPIQPEGMGVCENCGAIGVKHAFYTKSRRFCSMACARALNPVASHNSVQAVNKLDKQVPHVIDSVDDDYLVSVPQTQISSLKQDILNKTTLDNNHPENSDDEKDFPSNIKYPCTTLDGSYNWIEILSQWKNEIELNEFKSAPVTAFQHAPLSNLWANILVGTKVEMEIGDNADDCWLASIRRIIGYKALLRYEGCSDPSKDFWVHLCNSKVKDVGNAAIRGKPLIPPKCLDGRIVDWKLFIVKRLSGSRTLPVNFKSRLQESLKSRFRCDMTLEVVDRNELSQVKVAVIKEITGKRLHIQYFDEDPKEPGFWAHEDSPLIHPVGWAHWTGQKLVAPSHYIDRSKKGLRFKDDATAELFPLYSNLAYHTGFLEGMKLEAVDPLNLSTICVATVMKVLNGGYLMIRINTYDDNKTSNSGDWFCYHSTSAYVLPPNYCQKNGIHLTPPKNYGCEAFDWSIYLKDTNSEPAPEELFDLDPPSHQFEKDQRLEATDLMDPHLVCFATISVIVGRLMRVHFDGWDNEYDQWMDIQSPDVYPIGWCELVGYKLQGPGSQKEISLGKGRRKRKLKRLATKKDVVQNGYSEIDDTNQLSNKRVHHCDYNESSCEQINNFTDKEVEINATTSSKEKSKLSVKDDVIESEDIYIPVIVNSNAKINRTLLKPQTWKHKHVVQFLNINNCGATECFMKHALNGEQFLELTNDQVLSLNNHKVGPSLKIWNLVKLLRAKLGLQSLEEKRKL